MSGTSESIDIKNPRKNARSAVQRSVPAEQWKKNREFCDELKARIDKHRLNTHPLIHSMNEQNMPMEVAQIIHLEFGYAFAQIFTDSIVRAMFDCSQLEPKLRALGKVSARFLLELNLLDELGFQPTPEGGEEFAGNPLLAHYLQFDETLKALNITDAERDAYKPCQASIAARKSFEDQYGDYVLLTGVLAVAEAVFRHFAGPWAKSTSKAAGLDVSKGYHSIHVEDEDGAFLDDEHSEDSWFLFAQAIEPKRYPELRTKIDAWLDSWAVFCDEMVKTAQKHMG